MQLAVYFPFFQQFTFVGKGNTIIDNMYKVN